MTVTLAPLFEAPLYIQLHAGSALIALGLGPVALYRKRRDRIHKVAGYVWVLAMATVALSSFWITGFGVVGPFSPLHLLSVLVLWSLYEAMRHVFAGNIAAHQQVMRNLYWRGVMIAGLFNFLPGRITNRVFMDANREAGYVIIAVGMAIIAFGIWRDIQRKSVSLKTV